MNPKPAKPAWWILYVLVVVMLMIMTLEGVDGLPEWANQIASIGIVLIIFGSMVLWVRLNSANLWNEELRHNHIEEYTVTEYSSQETSLGRSNEHGNNAPISTDQPIYSKD